jgi:hydrogenase/urease accessory protein HupE
MEKFINEYQILVYVIGTAIWSAYKDKTKNAVIARFVGTAIIGSIMHYFMT